MVSRGAPWNHNIAYFPFIEKSANARPRRSALDVGTGDGMLAARLAGSVPIVVGLDLHQEQVDGAAATCPDHAGLRFEVGDVLTTTVSGEPFDFVACSATLHHMDLRAGLARPRDLTAPGGTLVIVGLASNDSALDWILSGLGVLPARIARAGRAGTTTVLRNAILRKAGARCARQSPPSCPAHSFGGDCTGAIASCGTIPLPNISTDTSP